MPPTYPDIPVPVWQQIAIVIVFAFLLIALIWVFVRILSRSTSDTTQLFVKAIAEVNQHYRSIIEQNNVQWQLYFDAKIEVTKLIDAQTVEKLRTISESLEKVTGAIDELSHQMATHEERAEQRQALLMATPKKINRNST